VLASPPFLSAGGGDTVTSFSFSFLSLSASSASLAALALKIAGRETAECWRMNEDLYFLPCTCKKIIVTILPPPVQQSSGHH
jgi:hypothetical protein